MSRRSLHHLAVTGLIITFGLLPLSAAHAAPVANPAATASGTVRAWGSSLLQSFQEMLGLDPDSTDHSMDQDTINGPTDPHDGVGIDPHGRPGR